MKRPPSPEEQASPAQSRLEGLQQRIDEWIEDSRSRAVELQAIVSSLRAEPWTAGTPSPAEPSPREARALEDLAELAREVGALPDQAAVLGRLLAAAGTLADRAVVFIVRDGALRGWKGAGLEAVVQPRSLAFPLSEDTLLSRAVESCDVACGTAGEAPARALLVSLGGGSASEMAAAPLWVRDRVAAVLYADTREPAGWLAGSLAAAATLASLALEALPLRARHPRPAGEMIPAVPAAGAGPPASAGPATPPEAPAPTASPEELEEVRRFARLLVSEIVLYNEAEIAEGRLHKDLSHRLKDDIERSRRMYEQRITPNLSPARDYFQEELVRGLAGGDESALGMT
jgi:hypothetical protein